MRLFSCLQLIEFQQTRGVFGRRAIQGYAGNLRFFGARGAERDDVRGRSAYRRQDDEKFRLSSGLFTEINPIFSNNARNR